MSSVVEICNIALSYLGQGSDSRINSLDDNLESAVACKLHYDSARRDLLQVTAWRFATKITTLALLDSDNTTNENKYVYKMPSDCLTPIRLYGKNGAFIEINSSLGRFKVNLDSNNQKIISCNLEDASLEYVTDLKDVNLFSPLFRKTLALYLAIEMSPSITNNKSIGNVYNLYQTSLASAIASNQNSDNRDDAVSYSFINARRG